MTEDDFLKEKKGLAISSLIFAFLIPGVGLFLAYKYKRGHYFGYQNIVKISFVVGIIRLLFTPIVILSFTNIILPNINNNKPKNNNNNIPITEKVNNNDTNFESVNNKDIVFNKELYNVCESKNINEIKMEVTNDSKLIISSLSNNNTYKVDNIENIKSIMDPYILDDDCNRVGYIVLTSDGYLYAASTLTDSESLKELSNYEYAFRRLNASYVYEEIGYYNDNSQKILAAKTNKGKIVKFDKNFNMIK